MDTFIIISILVMIGVMLVTSIMMIIDTNRFMKQTKRHGEMLDQESADIASEAARLIDEISKDSKLEIKSTKNVIKASNFQFGYDMVQNKAVIILKNDDIEVMHYIDKKNTLKLAKVISEVSKDHPEWE